MDIEFDPDKDAINIAKHGVSLRAAEAFEIIRIWPDDRFNYGERRYAAVGRIAGTIYILAFVLRGPERYRVISLRQANRAEVKRYAS